MRIPEFFSEINNPVIFNNDTFIFEKLFHGCGITEMMFPGQQAITVNNPVGRNKIRVAMA